ncbi:T-box transcription factor TBX20-like isoform X2 [Physella acuta]|uniref:T-box transcription factor TBX20-like isoform X1 n=1 Tax=Physella acuta TaxID=109671 RepID=UPI0027DC7C11|nr:T-box transcription factor TBX20-like isoform X1 [Physella acuta]XP_059165410.1 T-box transcription factor TBX20-like isoform X2 [Physella acuta]
MIITKSGRRMFPALKLRITGLNPTKMFHVKLEFCQPDTRKYRYIYHSSRWMVSGSGDTMTSVPCHVIQEGPISGQAICSQIVSFERLKMTNSDLSKAGQVSLVSMQKFQPQVVLEEVQADVDRAERYVIFFPQTSFMAVTAYQNQQITTLKIASNPFAKGFRESGKTRVPYEAVMAHYPSLLTYKTNGFSPGCSPLVPGLFQRGSLNSGKRCLDQRSYAHPSEKIPRKDIPKSATIEGDLSSLSPTFPQQYTFALPGQPCPVDQRLSLLYSQQLLYAQLHQDSLQASIPSYDVTNGSCRLNALPLTSIFCPSALSGLSASYLNPPAKLSKKYSKNSSDFFKNSPSPTTADVSKNSVLCTNINESISPAHSLRNMSNQRTENSNCIAERGLPENGFDTPHRHTESFLEQSTTDLILPRTVRKFKDRYRVNGARRSSLSDLALRSSLQAPRCRTEPTACRSKEKHDGHDVTRDRYHVTDDGHLIGAGVRTYLF